MRDYPTIYLRPTKDGPDQVIYDYSGKVGDVNKEEYIWQLYTLNKLKRIQNPYEGLRSIL